MAARAGRRGGAGPERSISAQKDLGSVFEYRHYSDKLDADAPGGHMSKVYQLVRGVVQGNLHRRKPDITVSARVKDSDGSLNDAI